MSSLSESIYQKLNSLNYSNEINNLLPKEFINIISDFARQLERNTGIFASITIAQAITESLFGNYRIPREAGNILGYKAIKDFPRYGNYFNFTRYNNIQTIKQRPYRIIAAWEQCINFRENFNLKNSKNKFYLLHQAANPQTAAFLLQYSYDGLRNKDEIGYALDDFYTARLLYFIDRYNLNQYNINTFHLSSFILNKRIIHVQENPTYTLFKPNSFQKKYRIYRCNQHGIYSPTGNYERVDFYEKRPKNPVKYGVRKIQNFSAFLTNPNKFLFDS